MKKSGRIHSSETLDGIGRALQGTVVWEDSGQRHSSVPSNTVTSGFASICLFIAISAQVSGKGCSESCYASWRFRSGWLFRYNELCSRSIYSHFTAMYIHVRLQWFVIVYEETITNTPARSDTHDVLKIAIPWPCTGKHPENNYLHGCFPLPTLPFSFIMLSSCNL